MNLGLEFFKTRSGDGAVAEMLIPRFWTECGPFLAGPIGPGPSGVKPWFLMSVGKPVPGTNVLADVAAKGPAIEHLLLFGTQVLFLFDAEVADARAAVDDSRLNNGLGRAGVDASRAAAAVIGNGLIGG